MKLLVTGASGFIGRHVVSEALARGHSVVAMVRPASSLTGIEWTGHENVKILRADLRNKDQMENSLENLDAVIHLAISQSSFADTIICTENLLSTMLHNGINRIVLISSFAVYKYRKIPPFFTIDEKSKVEDNPDSQDQYQACKLLQEEMVKEHAAKNGLQFTILRPGAVYGPERMWTARLGLDLSDKLWIRLGSWAQLPLTYVVNCAHAIVMAAESRHSDGEIFNIVDNENPTQRYYSRQLQKHFSPPPRIIPVPYAVIRLLAVIARLANLAMFKGRARLPQFLRPRCIQSRFKPYRYSNEKLKKVIGWTPKYTLQEALEVCFFEKDINKAK